MDAKIEVKQVSDDIIELLNITYYSERYLREMMAREYQRGKKKGETIHRLEPMSQE